MLSNELGYYKTHINNLTVSSAGCHYGLLLQNCNNCDTKNIEYKHTA